MGDTGDKHRFYAELAPWWPLISPVEDYAEEAAYAATLLRRGAPRGGPIEGEVRELLELGSGGGHNAAHLRAHFELTLVDIAPAMLTQSRALNPDSTHVQGDMRSVRLGRRFDAVFVHDAVDYMVDEVELAAVMVTAFEHCRPGAVAVFMPDDLRESFTPSTSHGGVDEGPAGRGARYLEWTWDPDPADTWVQTEYAFTLRDAKGEVTHVHESHRTGLFPRETWLDCLGRAGFEASFELEPAPEDRPPRTVFIARRPTAS